MPYFYYLKYNIKHPVSVCLHLVPFPNSPLLEFKCPNIGVMTSMMVEKIILKMQSLQNMEDHREHQAMYYFFLPNWS